MPAGRPVRTNWPAVDADYDELVKLYGHGNISMEQAESLSVKHNISINTIRKYLSSRGGSIKKAILHQDLGKILDRSTSSKQEALKGEIFIKEFNLREQQIEVAERQLTITKRMQAIAVQRLSTINPEDLSVREVREYIVAAADMQRKVLGMERLSINIDDWTKYSNDELYEMAREQTDNLKGMLNGNQDEGQD